MFLSASLFAQEAPGRVDINLAGIKDLTKVKGIGKKLAQRILDGRDKVGKFTSMHELKNIKGIGKATFEKLVCAFYVVEEGQLECKLNVPVPGSSKVNLNAAPLKELTTLPGVGKKKAQKIIDYRKEKGWFKTPYDLQNIKGIGKKSVENLLPKLEVKVDVNQARAVHFEELGFASGDKIIEQRQKSNGFKSVEEFGKLPVIDLKVFERVKEVLVVGEKK